MSQEEAKKLLQLTEEQRQLVSEFFNLVERINNAGIELCVDIESESVAAFNTKHGGELRYDVWELKPEGCVSVPLSEFFIKDSYQPIIITSLMVQDYSIDIKEGTI